MTPLRAIVIILALVLLPATAVAGAEDWRMRLLIDEGRADPRQPFEAFDAASLNLFDFDGDGTPEAVSSNDNNRVYVIDIEDGKIRAEIETTHPEGWAARQINPVAIGDLYGDGIPCLVIPNSAAYLSAWCYQGRTLTGRFDFERRWEIHVDAALYEPDFRETHPWIDETAQPGLDGNAFLSDVDGAPGLEVFVETDGYPGQFSFTHEGEYRWSRSWHDGNAGVVVDDLTGDGAKEAIFASDAGVISVYDADTGKERWSFDAREHGAEPGSVTLAPLVADLDADGAKEVVFAARHLPHGVWFALRADGSVLWTRSEPWMNPLAYNHPAAIDVDADGVLDVVALDWNTVGHKPGNWEPTEQGPNLFALDGTNGRVLWRASVPAYWSNKDFVIAGESILVNAESGGRDGLATYDLATGARGGFFALPEGWEAMRGPVGAEAGGHLVLVVPLARPDPSANYRELDVGHRMGALAIIDAENEGALRFSANILHTDAPAPHGGHRAFAQIPDLGAFGALGALLALALARTSRRG